MLSRIYEFDVKFYDECLMRPSESSFLTLCFYGFTYGPDRRHVGKSDGVVARRYIPQMSAFGGRGVIVDRREDS